MAIRKIEQEAVVLAPALLRGNSAPTKQTASSSSVDPWGDVTMGAGGILMQMAFEEAAILQQIGNIDSQITRDSMTEWQKIMSLSAEETKKSIQKDADQMQLDGIQNAVSAGVTGIQGGMQVYATATDSDSIAARNKLQELNETNTKLSEVAEQQKGIDFNANPLTQEQQNASSNALREFRTKNFQSAAERNAVIEKLSPEDVERAQYEQQQKIEAANRDLATATQKVTQKYQNYQTFGTFATEVTQAGVSFSKKATQSDKAVIQAASMRDSASADGWKQASQNNSQNTAQVLQERTQMLSQVTQAIREATRA